VGRVLNNRTILDGAGIIPICMRNLHAYVSLVNGGKDTIDALGIKISEVYRRKVDGLLYEPPNDPGQVP
jgi:hypothetical protein